MHLRRCGPAVAGLVGAVIGVGYAERPASWPGFPNEVIDAARNRRTVPAKRVSPKREIEIRAEEIEATFEGLLAAMREYGHRLRAETVRELGQPALEALLAILADDTRSPRYHVEAIRLLVPFGLEAGAQRDRDRLAPPIELRPVTKDAGRISDAILAYCRAHPTVGPGALGSILPPGRLPAVLELAEITTGAEQEAFIGIFQGLTFTKFHYTGPAVGFCGHDTPASMEQVVEHRRQKQAEAPRLMREWWEKHGEEVSEAWAIAAVKEHIEWQTAIQGMQSTPEQDREAARDTGHYRIRRYDQFIRFLGLGFGPSTFKTLVDEYRKADKSMRPYILNLIAHTRHLGATEFVAARLKDEDPFLQHASIVALGLIGRPEHADAVRDILRSETDVDLRASAYETLDKLVGAEAIGDYAGAVNDEDVWVRHVAQTLLRSHLPAHVAEVERIAKETPDKELAAALGELVDAVKPKETTPDAEGPKPSRGELVAKASLRLRAGDGESLEHGLGLVEAHELIELIPDVIALLHHDDEAICKRAAMVVGKLGVPSLTVESAPRLMGIAETLDRQIAAYCYAKYGAAALPVVERAVISWPIEGVHATNRAPRPAIGLIRVLIEHKVGDIVERAIKLAILKVRNRRPFIGLLGQMDDTESAALLGELLGSSDPKECMAAIAMTRSRRLTQHTDRLFEISMLAPAHDSEVQDPGGMSFEESSRVDEEQWYRPENAIRATMALIEFEDGRAWEATRHVLDSDFFDWKHLPGMSKRRQQVQELGQCLAAHIDRNAAEVRDMLRLELEGQQRYWIIEVLTVALIMDPVAGDADVLWMAASSKASTFRGRTRAAVALSKLGDPRAAPVLRDLARMALDSSWRDCQSSEVQLSFQERPRWPRFSFETDGTLLDDRLRFQPSPVMFENHHVNIGAALRRIGDMSLVDETVRSLIDGRGQFNAIAYRLLEGMTGSEARVRTEQYVRKIDADMLRSLDWVSIMYDRKVDLKLILSLVEEQDWDVEPMISTIVANRFAPAGDSLVAAYERKAKNGYDYWGKARLLRALCEIGDQRGLRLGSEDPELAAAVAHYVPDVSLVDFPQGPLKYSRWEDALRFRKWYKVNAPALQWNRDTAEFTLSARGK